MLTFSLNPSTEEVYEAGSIIAKRKPTSTLGRQWLSEAFIKRLAGKVGEEMNVDAYGYVCNENTKLGQLRDPLPLLTLDEMESGYVGIPHNLSDGGDFVRRLVEDIDFNLSFTLSRFEYFQDLIAIQEGINLQRLLSLLLMAGKPKLLLKLKKLISKYEMHDLIMDILSHPEAVEALDLHAVRDSLITNEQPEISPEEWEKEVKHRAKIWDQYLTIEVSEG